MKSLHETPKTLVRVSNNDIKDGHFNFPEGVNVIAENAFKYCTKLTTITLPQGIIEIEKDAFHGCTNLRTITLQHGLRNIGERVFYHCHNLSAITIAHGVREIPHNAFTFCFVLKYIIIDSKEESEINRIRALLPENLRAKVLKKSYFINWILNATEALNGNGLPADVSKIIKSEIQQYHTQMLNKHVQEMHLEAESICVIKEAYKQIVYLDEITFFKPSNFPEEATLLNIIAHAFSGGSRTMRALQQLNYINSKHRLTYYAPDIFKKAFKEYEKKRVSNSELIQNIITVIEPEQINSRVIAKYSFLNGLEMYNDYGKAMCLLGHYCCLYSDTSTNFNWAYRSDNEISMINFFNGNLLNTHTEIVKSFLKSRCSGKMYCSHESPWGNSAQVRALLLDLKATLLQKSTAFNPNGKLAITINDIQILCNMHCIDVIALSKDIEARTSTNNHNGLK